MAWYMLKSLPAVLGDGPGGEGDPVLAVSGI